MDSGFYCKRNSFGNYYETNIIKLINIEMKKVTLVFVFLLFFTSNLSFGQPYDFDLPDTYGNSVKLSEQLKTGPVLLLIWESRNKPGKDAMKVINELYEKYKDLGLNFIAVSIDKKIYKEKAKAYIKARGYNFTVVYDDNEQVFQAFEESEVPLVILLDKSGNVTNRYSGYFEGDEIKIESNIIEVLNLQ